jgi:hypothetical protein
VTAAYKNNRAAARPLMIDAIGDSLDADADAVLGASPSFNATLKMRNLNLEQTLRFAKYRGRQHRARISNW